LAGIVSMRKTRVFAGGDEEEEQEERSKQELRR
jgi:hypothetical protein